MRKTNTLEIVGIGEVGLISLAQKEQKFKMVTADGKEVTGKREGELSYYWIDNDGSKYTEEQVFYAVGDKKVQKINKTEKVNKFDIVEKSEVLGNFMSDSYSICDVSETTLRNFDKEIGNDKAITFVWKKSSRGVKFHRAYMYKFQNVLILVSGQGNISDGIKEYSMMKESSKTSKKAIKDVIEVQAEDMLQEITI